ncbi:MAG: ankyrin repeat domain-containing protein, partial [Verrucomicrobia bacterium]|nr:ankyrin repeat domain-containing protein [Verrucomicrobiota bacterium]
MDVRDDRTKTALMWAAHIGHTEVVQILLDHDADVNARTQEGWMALMSAPAGHKKELV